MGNPVLAAPASPVDDPTAASVRALVDNMVETMLDASGVGLAAPQVHVGRRVLVYFVPEGRTEDGAGVPLTALINPEITPLTEETDVSREACLSLPGLSGEVPRYTRIGLRALTLAGETIEREVAGYHARVLQHECDHLDGLLYPMRMTDLATFGFVEEQAKAARQEADALAEEEERRTA